MKHRWKHELILPLVAFINFGGTLPAYAEFSGDNSIKHRRNPASLAILQIASRQNSGGRTMYDFTGESSIQKPNCGDALHSKLVEEGHERSQPAWGESMAKKLTQSLSLPYLELTNTKTDDLSEIENMIASFAGSHANRLNDVADLTDSGAKGEVALADIEAALTGHGAFTSGELRALRYMKEHYSEIEDDDPNWVPAFIDEEDKSSEDLLLYSLQHNVSIDSVLAPEQSTGDSFSRQSNTRQNKTQTAPSFKTASPHTGMPNIDLTPASNCRG